MISIFTNGNFFLYLVLLLVALFLLRFILIPYLKVSSYKREGVDTYFFPILGFLKLFNGALKKNGDVMAYAKQGPHKSSKSKYMVTHLGKNLFILLHDPQYIKEFLQKQMSYHKSKVSDGNKLLTGTGLVRAEGERWKRNRRIISNSFHFEFIKSNFPRIQGTTKEFLDKVTPECYNKFQTIKRMQEITGEIVGRIFFGENMNNYQVEGKPVTIALAEIACELAEARRTLPCLLFGSKVLTSPLFPRYKRLVNRINLLRKICFDIINDRKANPKSNQDFLSPLLATQNQDDPEMRYSDTDIVNEFITFFQGGMDTTGHLISMVLYNLTQHPEYLKDLKIERDNTYNQEFSPDTLQKMEMLHCVIKETLRLHTPAPFLVTRVAVEDHDLLDLKIKKGDLVTPEIIGPGYDEKYFENPEKFDPLRWKRAEAKVDPYAFVPFSAGQRNCIGQHLAMIETKIILSEFMNRFEFTLDEGYELKMKAGLVYEPVKDIPLNLRPASK